MYLIFFGILGGIWGARLAKKRGGKRVDIIQYFAGYFLCYIVVGAIFSVILQKTGLFIYVYSIL
tara:strand:+ start:290 stop:481 length:192 start_codon:yes stop_codon:yes gene_type:complete